MSAQRSEWPKAGDTAWVVHHHHTWDAHNNNEYFPVPHKVLSVETGTVHLEDGADREIGECYISQEQCKSACPAPHPDE